MKKFFAELLLWKLGMIKYRRQKKNKINDQEGECRTKQICHIYYGKIVLAQNSIY